jgi:hypothetical protein
MGSAKGAVPPARFAIQKAPPVQKLGSTFLPRMISGRRLGFQSVIRPASFVCIVNYQSENPRNALQAINSS